MRYEWDPRKNRENQRKHEGINFEWATLVFEDENCLIEKDRVDESGEQRWRALGAVSLEPASVLILLVVHVLTEEEHNGEEIIRIVSARRAGKNDVRRYREQKMD